MAIPGSDNRSPIRVGPTQSVEPRGFEAQAQAARSLQGFGNELFQRAKQKANIEAENAGEREGAAFGARYDEEGRLIPMEKLPNDPNTLYGRAFQQSAIRAYGAAVANDARANVDEVLAKFPNNPERVRQELDAYTNGTLDLIAEDVRPFVEPVMRGLQRSAISKATSTLATETRASQRAQIENNVSALVDTGLQVLRTSGDEVEAEFNFRLAQDGLESLRASGHYSEAEFQERSRMLGSQIVFGRFAGTVHQALDSARTRADILAVDALIDEFERSPLEGVSEKERQSYARAMKARVDEQFQRMSTQLSLVDQERTNRGRVAFDSLVGAMVRRGPLPTPEEIIRMDIMPDQKYRMIGMVTGVFDEAVAERQENVLNNFIADRGRPLEERLFSRSDIIRAHEQGDLKGSDFRALMNKSNEDLAELRNISGERQQAMFRQHARVFDFTPQEYQSWIDGHREDWGISPTSAESMIEKYAKDYEKYNNARSVSVRKQRHNELGMPLTPDLVSEDIKTYPEGYFDMLDEAGLQNVLTYVRINKALPPNVADQFRSAIDAGDEKVLRGMVNVFNNIRGDGLQGVLERGLSADAFDTMMALGSRETGLPGRSSERPLDVADIIKAAGSAENANRRLSSIGPTPADADAAIESKIRREFNDFGLLGNFVRAMPVINLLTPTDQPPSPEMVSSMRQLVTQDLAAGRYRMAGSPQAQVDVAVKNAIEITRENWAFVDNLRGEKEWQFRPVLLESAKSLARKGHQLASRLTPEIVREDLIAKVEAVGIDRPIGPQGLAQRIPWKDVDLRFSVIDGSLNDPRGPQYAVSYRLRDSDEPERLIRGMRYRMLPEANAFDGLPGRAAEKIDERLFKDWVSSVASLNWSDRAKVEAKTAELARNVTSQREAREFIEDLNQTLLYLGLDQLEPPPEGQDVPESRVRIYMQAFMKQAGWDD